jgi:hypothetical protein
MKNLIALLAVTFVTACSSSNGNTQPVRVPVWSWEQPQTVESVVGLPTAGGLVYPDSLPNQQKRAPGQVAYFDFKFKSEGAFVNPGDHVFMIMDGAFNAQPNPAVPYAGRGWIFYRDRMCAENFHTSTATDCISLQIEEGATYLVWGEADDTSIRAKVFKNGALVVDRGVVMLDPLVGLSRVSLSVAGSVAGQGSLRVSGVRVGRYRWG